MLLSWYLKVGVDVLNHRRVRTIHQRAGCRDDTGAAGLGDGTLDSRNIERIACDPLYPLLPAAALRVGGRTPSGEGCCGDTCLDCCPADPTTHEAIATDHQQRHSSLEIEEHQTSTMPRCFFRKLDSELRKLTGKCGSLTTKLKSVFFVKIQFFV